jgi:hypothetical protein
VREQILPGGESILHLPVPARLLNYAAAGKKY